MGGPIGRTLTFAFNFVPRFFFARTVCSLLRIQSSPVREASSRKYRALQIRIASSKDLKSNETFVVAGGGFAGVELAGALNDFGRGMLADYPSLRPEDLRVILVHSRDRILPELSGPLAAYALERMRERGVTFKLNARLADAGPGAVVLKPDEEIRDIWKLRIKLEAEPGDPVHFLTVHGAGYKFLT
jgi:NADH dehydrogenase FAD-containing subunit